VEERPPLWKVCWPWLGGNVVFSQCATCPCAAPRQRESRTSIPHPVDLNEQSASAKQARSLLALRQSCADGRCWHQTGRARERSVPASIGSPAKGAG